MERTMIVCWRWNKWVTPLIEDDFKDNPDSLNPSFYDEYIVHHPGEETPQEPLARVVRTRLKCSKGDIGVLNFLKKLIEKYHSEENQIFLFLHRGDGFTNTTIEKISKWGLVSRSFLFGGGKNDFIYFAVGNAGLLGEDGDFHWTQPSADQRQIIVAEDETRRVLQPFFDKTWHYYEFEFYNKLFELREDVMSHFYPMLNGSNPQWTMSDYVEKLKEHRLLFLRVKSFINDECNCLQKEEIKELKEYEGRNRKSFLLDDCRANLKSKIDVGKEYDAVIEYFQQMMNLQGDKLTGNVRHDLSKLNREFEELLSAIQRQYQAV